MAYLLTYRPLGALPQATPPGPGDRQEAMLKAETASSVPVFTTCPHCSYLVDNSCVVCEAGDTHPGCEDCVDGKYAPPNPPWWKSEFLKTLATSLTVSVVSMLVVFGVRDYLDRRKKGA